MTTEVYKCSLTIVDLKEFAKNKGLSGLSKMKKDELVKKICETYSDELKIYENELIKNKSNTKTEKKPRVTKKQNDESKEEEKKEEKEKKPPKITLKTFNSIENKKSLWLTHVGTLDKGVHVC